MVSPSSLTKNTFLKPIFKINKQLTILKNYLDPDSTPLKYASKHQKIVL